jgi:hypothetical protein
LMAGWRLSPRISASSHGSRRSAAHASKTCMEPKCCVCLTPATKMYLYTFVSVEPIMQPATCHQFTPCGSQHQLWWLHTLGSPPHGVKRRKMQQIDEDGE